MGKLAPEERARIGKLLNGARQKLERALEARKQALRRGRPATPAWTPNGSTSRCPRPVRGAATCIPSRSIQREIEDLFRSLGFAVLDGPEVEDRISQFRRAEHSARPSRARHAGHLLAGRRQPAAHPHVARAGARHGAARARRCA